MTDPARTSPPLPARPQRALLQPMLAAFSEAGVPLGPGDLDRLHHAAAIGPEFAHALARWIRAAHTTAVASPERLPVGVRTLAPRPERPVLGVPRPVSADVQGRHAS